MFERAVILAGGKGTRLRPVTFEIPKPLVPVQGRSILTWQVRWLARAGVKHVTVIIPLDWRAKFEEWRAALEEEIIVELWIEREPMGTLGALVHELAFAGEPVIVTNGDELKGLDLAVLADFHMKQREEAADYAATVALISVPNPSDYGVAEMEKDRIKKFHEKPERPPTNLISSGLYVIEPSSLEPLKSGERFLMFEKEYFPTQAESGRLGGCQLEGLWFDCGTLERWERAIREWRES